MPRLALVLVVASWLWPAAGAAAVWSVSRHGADDVWPPVVYAAASLVCHQRPERSFATAGVQWPVCGRCSGLYLAAPIGAAVGWIRRRTRADRRWVLPVSGVAIAPTVLSVAIEIAGFAPIGNVARFVLALPAGAALALVVVRTAAGAAESIG